MYGSLWPQEPGESKVTSSAHSRTSVCFECMHIWKLNNFLSRSLYRLWELFFLIVASPPMVSHTEVYNSSLGPSLFAYSFIDWFSYLFIYEHSYLFIVCHVSCRRCILTEAHRQDTDKMFHGAKAFNGDISKWDVSSVNDMHKIVSSDFFYCCYYYYFAFAFHL